MLQELPFGLSSRLGLKTCHVDCPSTKVFLFCDSSETPRFSLQTSDFLFVELDVTALSLSFFKARFLNSFHAALPIYIFFLLTTLRLERFLSLTLALHCFDLAAHPRQFLLSGPRLLDGREPQSLEAPYLILLGKQSSCLRTLHLGPSSIFAPNVIK